MSIADSIRQFFAPRRAQHSPIHEAVATKALQERLADLELSIAELGWSRLGQRMELEFSRAALLDIWKACRYSFVKNPIINRAVTLQAIYVFGQGVTFEADNQTLQAFVDDFVADPKNRTELFSHQARIMKEQDLQVLGNIFFSFHTRASDGKTILRSVIPQEVIEIVSNPDDAKDPWFYHRQWEQPSIDLATGRIGAPKSDDAYFPSTSYLFSQKERPATLNGIRIEWNVPIYHMKSGGLSDMEFAVPEIFQGLDWSMAYVKFLQDWARVVAAHATYAMKLTTGGGKQGQLDVKAKLGSTFSEGSTGEQNPRPSAGAFFVTGSGSDLAPMRTAGATENPEGARRLLLMICAAVGMPETFFGDVSTGNLATAKSLDRPTELKFRDRQTLWSDAHEEILVTAARIAKLAPASALRSNQAADVGTVKAVFPPILEHDVAEQMAAIVSGATLNGNASANTIDRETLSRLVLQALAVEDVDDVLERLQAEWDAADAEEQARADAMAAAVQSGLGQPNPGAGRSKGDAAGDPQVKEAIRELAAAVKVLHEKAIAGTYTPARRKKPE